MRWLWIVGLTAGSQAETPPGSPVAGECRDPDGDGFGRYCADGPDCDETDAEVHEGCDGCGSRDECGSCDEWRGSYRAAADSRCRCRSRYAARVDRGSRAAA